MKKEEITQNNKLIAEFMGWKEQTDPTERYFGEWFNNYGQKRTCKHKEILLFHSSWDWLMPIVEKIKELDYDIIIYPDETYILYNNGSYLFNTTFSGDTRFNLVYKAVIEFIKWYKENK